MSKYYEARLFRRRDPHLPMDGIGSHKYDAANDSEAVVHGKALHRDFYDSKTDQISIWEVGPGDEDRLVVIVEGP